MNFPSLASILLVASTLALTACPAGSDDTESGTASASSTDAATTGTASASSTDGTTTGATDGPGTPTSGSTSDVTTGPGTVTNVTDTGSTATDTGESSGTTGEPDPVEASCGNACDTVMACEPEVYATREECVQECSEAASPDPACQSAAAAFNDCIAGYTCEQLAASDEGDFGECADEFNAYLASCE